MGYKLDTSFLGKPHEWSPQRLYSQTGADWQYRVDFERLRKERLQRTREQPMHRQRPGRRTAAVGPPVRLPDAVAVPPTEPM